MRLFLLLLLAGCADRDPCAGHDGTCIGLTVRGSGNVDQLQVKLTGAARLDGRTPSAPGKTHPLPVTTALFLPSVGGAVDVEVTGFLAAATVGQGTVTALVRPGQHQTIVVTLSSTQPFDLAGAHDLAGADLAGADLADLAVEDLTAPVDLTVEDLSLADFSQPDLYGTGPRYVFLLPARSSNLGPIDQLDGDCTAAAAAGGLPATPYRALVGYTGVDPVSYVSLTEHRNIVKPDGTKVSTDDDFFSSSVNHVAPIDQLADQSTVLAGCAYTDFSRTGMHITNPNGDCLGWSVNTNATSGTTGDVKASDTHWQFDSITSCDLLSCHIYCIQQ